jgi:multidrug efflux pump subunit AcrB
VSALKLVEYPIRNQVVSWMIVVLLLCGGLLSFLDLGRLEDPSFTIKQAVVVTAYPGASALEVEEEVTLPLENAIQQLPYVYFVRSISSNGLSQIEVEMKSIYRKQHLAQIWDEMRRKINDLAGSLPEGVAAPVVNDDFADVYGVFLAVSGEGYDYDELADFTDFLRRELVLVEGVGKVAVGGRREEQVIIEVDRARLTASGFSPEQIRGLLGSQNQVTDAGNLRIADEYLRISTLAQGSTSPMAQLGGLLLGNRNGQLVYLSDVAKLYKDYAQPPKHLYRFNGRPALTLGVSFAPGVNVVQVGEALHRRLAELEYARPVGMQVDSIYDQPARVANSVNDFLKGLGQSVAIVILVLMFTMGLRAGVLMSAVLLLTIAGTFIIMDVQGIELHRISLGALIIALGMLVDNAIVVTEGIMIGLQRGYSRLEAARRIVSHTRWPLLGATLIAITAFAPIGLSPDASGEFTGSLFWVLFISLFISWIMAVSLTPFFCYLMFAESNAAKGGDGQPVDPYRSVFYQAYRGLLHLSLRYRWGTIVLLTAALLSALVAFTQVRQAFFPDSSLPLLMINYWLPQGSDIRATSTDVGRLEQRLLRLPEVEQITTTVGRGAERFMLTYAPEKSYANYAQLIVQARDFQQIDGLLQQVEAIVQTTSPHAFIKYDRPALGPSTSAKVEARFSGPDPVELRRLGQQAIAIFDAEAEAINVRQDWYERTKLIRPVYDEAAAMRLGISQSNINAAIAMNMQGAQIGTYRHGSKVLPILIRPPPHERKGVEQLQEVQVYSPSNGVYVNIGQFVREIRVEWEDRLIKRRDRKRTLAVLADPAAGSNPHALLAKVRTQVEALPLPSGYALQWGGEYEAQQKANKAVFAFVPLGVLMMVVINVLMFNSLKQTLVIWLTVPLAIIGVAYGLLLTDSPFSFMALLAVLSLMGMQIKNGIVLVEEIKRLREAEGLGWHRAISDAAVSRLRPVSMAAITTILGMLPLLGDVFFQPMAVTIMFGLGFASVLTLIVVPVLFSLFYIKGSEQKGLSG